MATVLPDWVTDLTDNLSDSLNRFREVFICLLWFCLFGYQWNRLPKKIVGKEMWEVVMSNLLPTFKMVPFVCLVSHRKIILLVCYHVQEIVFLWSNSYTLFPKGCFTCRNWLLILSSALNMFHKWLNPVLGLVCLLNWDYSWQGQGLQIRSL